MKHIPNNTPPKQAGRQIGLRLDGDVLTMLEECASAESRSLAVMAKILVTESLNARLKHLQPHSTSVAVG